MKIYLVPKQHPADDVALLIAVNDNSLSIARFKKVEDELKGDLGGLLSSLKCEANSRNPAFYRGRIITSAESIGLLFLSGNWMFENASVLDFSKGYGSGERSAHAMWRFNLNDSSMVADNSFAETIVKKSSNWIANRRNPRNAVLYLPFSKSKPNDPDATLQVFADNPKLVSCITGQKMKVVSLDEIYRLRDEKGEFLPSLVLTQEGISPSGEREFRVNIKWTKSRIPEGEEVFLSTTAGYLNKQRLFLDGKGVGHFKWLPLALDSGEKVTIQAGFRLFTGIASVTVEV